MYILNNDVNAARYEFRTFCENDAVTIRAWYNPAGDADDDENRDSLFCQSNAPKVFLIM